MDRTVQQDILDTPRPFLPHIKKIEHVSRISDHLLGDLPAFKRRIISCHSYQEFRVHLGHLRLIIVVFRIQYAVILSDHQHLRLTGLRLTSGGEE